MAAVVPAVVVMLVLHGLCFLAALGESVFLFRAYMWTTCCALPLVSVLWSLIRMLRRQWHWGQAGLFLLVSSALSFVQLLLIGRASAI
jgi:hypothetical protein